MVTTSLQKIFNCGSWLYDTEHFKKLMDVTGKSYSTIDDHPLSFSRLLDLTDISYAIDVTASRPDLSLVWRRFSIWCTEPFYQFATEEACKSAFQTTKRFILGDKTSLDLAKAHEAAMTAHFTLDFNGLNNINHHANLMMVNVSNPCFHASIDNCFLGYAYGKSLIGQPISHSEEIQTSKFLELIT